eukprot:2309886-Pyramimonas_sp.AAC.1
MSSRDALPRTSKSQSCKTPQSQQSLSPAFLVRGAHQIRRGRAEGHVSQDRVGRKGAEGGNGSQRRRDNAMTTNFWRSARTSWIRAGALWRRLQRRPGRGV